MSKASQEKAMLSLGAFLKIRHLAEKDSLTQKNILMSSEIQKAYIASGKRLNANEADILIRLLRDPDYKSNHQLKPISCFRKRLKYSYSNQTPQVHAYARSIM